MAFNDTKKSRYPLSEQAQNLSESTDKSHDNVLNPHCNSRGGDGVWIVRFFMDNKENANLNVGDRLFFTTKSDEFVVNGQTVKLHSSSIYHIVDNFCVSNLNQSFKLIVTATDVKPEYNPVNIGASRSAADGKIIRKYNNAIEVELSYIGEKPYKMIVEMRETTAVHFINGINYKMQSEPHNDIKSIVTDSDCKDYYYDKTNNVLLDGCKKRLIWGFDNSTIPNSVTEIGDNAFDGCSGLTSITIPKSVTEIGSCAFYECKSLTTITIPDSVTKIGGSAFDGCASITSITIPNSVTEIVHRAFENWASLTTIAIPDSVTEIGNDAFSGCKSLTSITIPDSVTEIGECVFEGCSNLREIKISSNNSRYRFDDVNLVLIDKSNNSLIWGCSDSQIPDGVDSIGDCAFSSCKGLTSITIPDSVTKIGENAFYECTSLTSITIPDSVTEIGIFAFTGCSSLTSITIPNSVTEIGEWMLNRCTSLTSITIPNGVTEIGEYAFSGCTSLTSITIPANVKTIVDSAFYGCDSLEEIIFDGPTKLKRQSFAWCRNLKKIKINCEVIFADASAFHGSADFEVEGGEIRYHK